MTNPKVRMYKEQSFGHLKGLAGISDRQIAEHLALYAGYVRQVNKLNEELAELRSRSQASARHAEFAELTRRLGFEYNGMILHEYYFSDLRPAPESMPRQGSKLADALTEAFGSVDQWLTAFQAIAAMRGVGWVILFQDAVTKRLSDHWISLHQDGVPAGFKPLLVMDVWEHAFMPDYRASERVLYIDAFFRNVDWEMVERRLEGDIAIRPAVAA